MAKKITLHVVEEKYLHLLPKVEEVTIYDGSGERCLYRVKSRYHGDQWILARSMTESLELFEASTRAEMRDFYEGEDPGDFDEWPLPKEDQTYDIQEPDSVELVTSEVLIQDVEKR